MNILVIIVLSIGLLLTESDPICNTKNITVVENNYIEMWCIVNYSGNWAPVMEWGQEVTDNTVLEEFNGNVTSRTTNNSVKSTLRLLADSRRRNSRYYCKTYFTNDSILYSKRKLVQNVPTYNHTWISPIINVLYGPKNMKITQQLEIFQRGIVNCSAEANPSANYTWTEISSGNYSYGPMLILNENFIPGQTYTFECAASNYIGSPLTKNVTLTVPYKLTDNAFYKFAVITGSLISFFVLLVVTIFAKKNVKERCMGKNSRKSLDIISNHEVLPLGTAEDNYAVSYEDSTASDERSSRAANLSSHQGATEGPVYSVVHKNRVTYEQSSSSHTEEAVCNNSIYKMPRANRQSKQTENKNNNLDGIIYTELDQVQRESLNRDPNIVRVQFKKSEYVAIDHTLQVPSPVPQLNFNLSHL